MQNKLNIEKNLEQYLVNYHGLQDSYGHSVAVLILNDHLLLIKRSRDLPSHKGQIGFIGGSKLPGETILQTANREYTEETGLDSKDLKFLGYGAPSTPSNGKKVVPCIFTLHNPIKLEEYLASIITNGEWDEAFFIPLTHLYDSSFWRRANYFNKNQKINILFFPFEISLLTQKNNAQLGDKILWGMTARIIYNLLSIS